MTTSISVKEGIQDIGLSDALGERYLAYALSTIMSRSMPDVRDGLKPVHRRLFYAMRWLKLDASSGFKKCARIVGDVMGKYHPHGDQAIYDAMVRLAQDFAQRYPLVDGQGNFGNIDGDNAAAMRYTEARLTEVAEALLVGIDENAVDFRTTYDGEEDEPVVLPAAFPNLLANGAQGIAVGMATSIPPHNIGELHDALLYLIKHPNATIEKLVEWVVGPDFPTGGVLVEPHCDILNAYKTGRGGFRLRARWEVEKLRLGMYQIVITEIPYQVQKSRLVEKIAKLILSRKLSFLTDIRDESTSEVRLVLEPKNRAIDPSMVMETLFKQTDLEIRFPLNMNVIDADNTPKIMNLREVLQAFLKHRHEILVRRSKYRQEKIEHRLEILAGYLIAYLNLDAIIRIIRQEDEPKRTIISVFGLTDIQADAILNMRLRQLRKLEEVEIKKEHDLLSEEKVNLQTLLSDESLRWKRIGEEITEIKKKFGPKTNLGRRRCEIGNVPLSSTAVPAVMVEREPVTVLCSQKGWIRTMKGHVIDVSGIRYKEGDAERFLIHCQTTDKLLIFGTDGRFYTLNCDKLPNRRGDGEPLRLMIELDSERQIAEILVHKPGEKLIVASASGRGFLVKEDMVIARTRSGRQVLNVNNEEEARFCKRVIGDSVAVVGQNRKLLIFNIDEIPERMRGRGVILQRYKDGGLSDIKTFMRFQGLSWNLGERIRTESNLAAWIGRRASSGRLPPSGFPRNNKFS